MHLLHLHMHTDSVSQLSRQFENACTQGYMQQHIRGFMHLDNGQESIPAFVGDSIKKEDIKYSYYREHTHALASGVSPGKDCKNEIAVGRNLGPIFRATCA